MWCLPRLSVAAYVPAPDHGFGAAEDFVPMLTPDTDELGEKRASTRTRCL